MRSSIASAAAAASLVLAACGGAETDEPGSLGTSRQLVVADNGRSFNGRSFNGRSFNGRSLDSALLTGVKKTGVQIRGVTVSNLSLAASVFSGTVDGEPKKGTQFAGSTWQGMLSDGSTIPVRVDAITSMPRPNADLLGYAISVQTDTGWVPACGYEPNGSEVLAVPMAGLWNYGGGLLGGDLLGLGLLPAGGYDAGAAGYTFACRHFAIGKCLEMGYRPWSTKNGESLQPYTVSCVRALRADYCGTAVSFTLDGTLIDVYDRAGIQVVAEPTWPIEAEWGPNGARCMAPANKDRFATTNQLLPPCYLTLALTGCGGRFRQGTYLISRFER